MQACLETDIKRGYWQKSWKRHD